MYISSPVALFGLVVSCMLGQAFSKPGAAPLKQRQNDCNPLPAGSGPVPSPDTATAFEADTFFSNAALSAVTPTGYNNTFTNLACSNNAEGYMGYRTLDEYDVGACAAICDSAPGCMAFNICKCQSTSLYQALTTKTSNGILPYLLAQTALTRPARPPSNVCFGEVLLLLKTLRTADNGGTTSKLLWLVPMVT